MNNKGYSDSEVYASQELELESSCSCSLVLLSFNLFRASGIHDRLALSELRVSSRGGVGFAPGSSMTVVSPDIAYP
eukprot:2663021-Rhodomonas_salina.1